MSKKGLQIILSGFSGSGKGTVVKKLVEKYDNYALSISATTRGPRDNEVENVSYFYITRQEFEELINQDKLLEYAVYSDNYYGTPAEYVYEKRNAGYDVILEIETQGALKVKEKCPESILIFMMPPSIEELRKRLTDRGTETEEEINKRLQQAKRETKVMDQYDYLIINDNVDDCVELLHNIIVSEHKRVENRLELIEKCKIEINNLLEGE